jgi:agmatine deiminase
LLGLRFRTNGWGGKFIYEYDDQVGDAICAATKARIVPHDFVLEGGSIEHNGAGTIMTTRECILNPNRNPSWSEHDAEHALKQAFHADRLVWIDFGMKNDHTDGHIDNIARFVGEDHVVCQKPYGSDDPNAVVFAAISQRLKSEGFRVSEITSPGLVKDDSGEVVPASHMNFVIANGIIVVPTYGGPSTATALAELQKVFPNRRVVGSSSRAVLTGGGSFHCITQQQPARRLL